MKQITVRNVSLLFDDDAYDGSPLEQAHKLVREINEVLPRLTGGCPQLSDSVVEADVEIAEAGMSKPAVYKYVVTAIVLSTEADLDAAAELTLADLHQAIDSGDCIGNFEVTQKTKLTDRSAVGNELKAIGNDGSFFDAEFERAEAAPDEEFQRLPTGVRGRAIALWEHFGSEAARTEGWDLYTRDNGELEIEYIAEPQEVPELRDRGIVDPPFHGDDEVIRHCLAKARQGSRVHQLALYLEGRIRDSHCWVPDDLVAQSPVQMPEQPQP